MSPQIVKNKNNSNHHYVVIKTIFSSKFVIFFVKIDQKNDQCSFFLQWGASSRWSIRQNTAWSSIQTATIGKTHPTLLFSICPVIPQKNHTNESSPKMKINQPQSISQSITKSNSRNRYKIIVPKNRIVRKFRIFHRIYQLFEFDVAIYFLSKNQKRIMIMWSFLFDSYKWLIFLDSIRFSAFKMHQKRGFLDWCCGCLPRGRPKIGFL